MFDLNSKIAIENTRAREVIADARTIKALENQLSDSDYKIIKCYEYSLMGLELPYNIETLHNEREALREEIRKIEEKE